MGDFLLDPSHANLSREQLLRRMKKARSSSGLFAPLDDEKFEVLFGDFGRIALSILLTDYEHAASATSHKGDSDG